MAQDAGPALPAEVKQQFDALQGTLKGLRDKQTEIETQLKKRGSEDVVTKDELKKVGDAFDKLKDKLNDEINALHRKANRQPVTTIDKQSLEIQTKANLEFANLIGKQGDDVAGAAARTEYKRCFDKMVRRGEKALSPDEQKTLSAGSAPDGGFFIEPERSSQIIDRLRETSPMRAIASVMTINGNSIKFPVDRDDAGYEWVSETGTRNVTNTPQVGELEIPVHEVSAMPKATQNLLDDAGIDVESWLNQKVADRFARAENTAFVTGTGVAKPAGFLSQTQGAFVTTADSTRAFGALQYKGTGSSGAFRTASATVSPADDLLDLIHYFNAGYRANLRWTMNKTTLGQIRKFKDQQGNYIYNPQLTATAVIDVVLGYPVTEFADMSDYLTANAYAVAIGDFKRGYLIVDRQGIRQLRDVYTSKPHVLFYTTKRVGGAIIDSDAIKLLKMA